MGYFSTLSIDDTPYPQDHSYTPPEQQLLWRLEELEDRLHELTAMKTGRRDDGACFSVDDLRYALPEDFLSVSDLRAAIDLAISDLESRFGIQLYREPEEKPAEDGITGMQLSFGDLLVMQAYTNAA